MQRQRQAKKIIEKLTWKMVYLQSRVKDVPCDPKVHRAQKPKMNVKLTLDGIFIYG